MRLQMPRWRSLSIPALLLVLTGIPVGWALPADMPLWRSAAIVLGWGGTGLLLASLLLMVREVRLADWLGGLERITYWHHTTGIAAYALLLLHPLALAVAGWNEAPALAWQVISPFSGSLPVGLGWASLIFLMLGLATTFRARLPYRVWRWLHGLLGIGVTIGCLHLFALGIGAGAWLTVAVAIVLLLWRILRIDLGAAAHPYIVKAVQPVARAMVEIRLSPLATPIDAQPGQFVMVAFFKGTHYRGCGEFHPFTISGTDANRELRIGVKALGDCTRCMQALEPGVSARIHGPFGDFLSKLPPRPQLWIAGGIGITPFLGVLRQRALQQPTQLLYLYRGAQEAAYLAELTQLAHSHPELALTVDATETGVPDLAQRLPLADALTGRECYVCGPPALIEAVSRLLIGRGLPADRIHFERFDFR